MHAAVTDSYPIVKNSKQSILRQNFIPPKILPLYKQICYNITHS